MSEQANLQKTKSETSIIFQALGELTPKEQEAFFNFVLGIKWIKSTQQKAL